MNRETVNYRVGYAIRIVNIHDETVWSFNRSGGGFHNQDLMTYSEASESLKMFEKDANVKDADIELVILHEDQLREIGARIPNKTLDLSTMRFEE